MTNDMSNTLQPKKITFYAYVSSEQDKAELEKALNDFGRSLYTKGILLTAAALKEAVQAYGNNPIVTNYIKSKTKLYE